MRECNIDELKDHYRIFTEDGVQLSLDRVSGEITSFSIGNRKYELGHRPAVRFEEVLPLEDAPNLLTDNSAAAWGVSEDKLEQGKEEGDRSLLRVTGNDKPMPSQVIHLNQIEPTPVIVSGTCRYSIDNNDVVGWLNRWLALNVVGTYTDGESMREQSAYFGQYNHGPQSNSRVLCPDKPLKSVRIELTAAAKNATAWFGDIALKPARYSMVTPQGSCTRLDHGIVQDFSTGDAAISGQISYQLADSYIVVRGHFRSEKKIDRAVSAYFAIPFDAVGGLWHDDVRNSRRIEAGKTYRRSDRWYGAGRDGYDDRYPLACVTTDDGTGLVIATDLAEPRVFRTEYDDVRKELRIRYDIGLSPDAGKWANRGSFTAYVFSFDGRDGFRGAADKFQRIFAWAFEKRINEEGMWIPFLTPERIPGGWEDFKFRYVEAEGNMGWEQQQGMHSLRYALPWVHPQWSVNDLVLEELKKTADPMSTLDSALAWRHKKGLGIPDEYNYRYAAYLGSYITDNWAQPQGYFFRQKGRMENMMLVDPNPDLPAPDGAHLSFGAYELEYLMQQERVTKSLHIDGWALRRATPLPFAHIDTETKTSGKQSLRLDPVRSVSYMQYCRGIDQIFYYTGDSDDPFELSYSYRGENIPPEGTQIVWDITFWYEDGTSELKHFKLDGINSEWKRARHELKPKVKPFAVNVGIGKQHIPVDLTTVWIDDVRFGLQGSDENLLVNGDFESAEVLPCKFGGAYLDIMESLGNNFDYRREHWMYAEEPLTFDSARKPALQVQFLNITWGKRAAKAVHERGGIIFANCAPVTCFAAPYMDAMGGEEFWMPGGKWHPKSDAEFNFIRFMCGPKSWHILQYDPLDKEHVERYVKRCAFYGMFPSRIYVWTDPVIVAAMRPVYAKFMPIIVAMNEAGWRPLTLAESDNPNVRLERFGDGNIVYLSVFNATGEPQSAEISLDPRIGVIANGAVYEVVGQREVILGKAGRVLNVTVQPEDLQVFKLSLH